MAAAAGLSEERVCKLLGCCCWFGVWRRDRTCRRPYRFPNWSRLHSRPACPRDHCDSQLHPAPVMTAALPSLACSTRPLLLQALLLPRQHRQWLRLLRATRRLSRLAVFLSSRLGLTWTNRCELFWQRDRGCQRAVGCRLRVECIQGRPEQETLAVHSFSCAGPSPAAGEQDAHKALAEERSTVVDIGSLMECEADLDVANCV